MTTKDLKRKALEIGHGVFRIVERITEMHLKNELRMLSVRLIEEQILGKISETLTTIELIEGFIMLGESVGEVAYRDSQIMYRELDLLRIDLLDLQSQESERFDLEAIFSGISEKSGNTANSSKVPNYATPPASAVQRDDVKRGSHDDRLQIIAKRVAELGHAAMRDIIAVLPDVSERTLRYDLQKLCEQGILERIGSGGPASYYKARERMMV